MKIRDIMTTDVEVISPDATVQEAAKLMKDLDVGAIPVCDGERLLGMLTDRDITSRSVAEGMHPAETKAHETMTPNVIYCYEDQDLEEAALIMMEEQIRRLPIISRDKRLVGIISLGDVAVDVDDSEVSGDTLSEISEPSEPDR